MLLFFVCLTASAVGAVAGFGGGVIIKPVLDALKIMPVSTVSFLSGCTVLSMSAVSLLRSRKNGVVLQVETSTPLALGAAAGGLAGKELFEYIQRSFGRETILGLIQSVLLLATTILVFIYILKKDRIPSLQIKNRAACFIIGLFLGMVSSFLGIGGGPVNVAALFFFFSMEVKRAAKNSIYIILFSQAFSLVSSLVQGTVPEFKITWLLCMVFGGIGGALLGAAASKKLDAGKTERLLYALMLLIIGINIYNLFGFISEM